MSKISKELIESYRKIVLPFVSNQLYKTNFEGQGETDKTEFERDFNEILNLATLSLNSSGDLISREALLKAIREYAEPSSKLSDDFSKGMTECACEILDKIDNAPPVEHICPCLSDNEVKQPCLNSPCERPQGEWVFSEKTDHWKCSKCGELAPLTYSSPSSYEPYVEWLSNICPSCGADMRGGSGSE